MMISIGYVCVAGESWHIQNNMIYDLNCKTEC